MIIRVVQGITVLNPEKGYKYITNDKVWTDEAWLGKYDKVENWYDTNEEPPEEDEQQ